MTPARKNSEARQKDLKLAIYRIERGRSHTKADKLSVSAVAREAGVTPALIHNHYPAIAEEIRIKLGASSRQQGDAKATELKSEREKGKVLRAQLAEAEGQIARLASINEMLLLEVSSLKAQASGSNVRVLTRSSILKRPS